MDERSKFIDQLKKEKRIVRITFLGDGAVGKSSLVSQFLTRYGKEEYQLPEEERTPFMNITSWKQGDMTIQCFDLAGQRVKDAHPIDLMSQQVLGALDVIFYVFTQDRFSSFENIETWYNLTEKQINGASKSMENILVGNKKDLKSVIDSNLIDTTLNNGMFSEYISTSAVTEHGIQPMIDVIEKIGKRNLELE